MKKMIPGIDPRQLKSMMRQMGMSQEDIKANKVVITTDDGNLVFNNPVIQKIIMKGETSFQLSGSYTIEKTEVEEVKEIIDISKEDIKIVSDEASVSLEEAKLALEETKGDIAEAIVNLTEKKDSKN